MRLWSLHPRYLDARGLVALWREALLAQAVLRGQTIGYVHHPQLHRFRAQASPSGAIAEYLRSVHSEAVKRGYAFAAQKINSERCTEPLPVTRGQLEYEWEHLLAKLSVRDPDRYNSIRRIVRPQSHPLFRVVSGDVEEWERAR